MRLNVLNSGSSGNGYVLHNKNEALIIECGVEIRAAMQVIDFNSKIINGCIVSHSHLDHSGKIQQYAQKGIKVYSHRETFRGFNHHNFIEIDDKKSFRVGRFRVKAFEVDHDVKTYGFYINHPETGNICFITDATHAPFQFKGLNHIMIEANYSRDVIDANETHYYLRDRVVGTHMSYHSCMDFLVSQDMSEVQTIILLHASDSNSDIGTFSEKVRDSFNRDTFVAFKGLEIDFNKNPF